MILTEMPGNISKERMPDLDLDILSKGSTGRKCGRMFETIRWEILLANFDFLQEGHAEEHI